VEVNKSAVAAVGFTVEHKHFIKLLWMCEKWSNTLA